MIKRDLKKISILLPCYNEQECVALIFKTIQKEFNNSSIETEIIFINDGSSDGTELAIQEIIKENANVLGISFTRNFGKEAALHAGLKACTGEAAIILDSDGQHPPKYIHEFIVKYKEGFSVISGIKKETRQHFLSYLASKLFNKLFTHLTSLSFHNESDFKLIDRKVINTLNQMNEYNRFFRGLIKWTGYEEDFLYFDVESRYSGKTKWNFYSLVKLALDAIFTFSTKPLSYTVYIGVFGMCISIILSIIAIALKINGQALSGWASLIIVITFFSCLILTSIGIVGIYLMKISQEIKGRPHYIIKHSDI